ncbi:hypothetical protein AAMO2058_001632900 [Amorphochlora amoebiformis]
MADAAASNPGPKPRKRKHEKVDKNAPEELSSKKPVSRFRQIMQRKKFKPRDPRFDENCGALNPKMFRKAYSFVDDIKSEELRVMNKMMKKTRSKNNKSALKDAINKHKQAKKMQELKEKEREIRQEWEQKEREMVGNGKKQYFLKKSDVKKIMLAEKYLQLKKEGRLDKAMAKRRKKNASKDHRWMPRAPTSSRGRARGGGSGRSRGSGKGRG